LLQYLRLLHAAHVCAATAQNDVREQAYRTCAGVCVATAVTGCAPCFAAAVPIAEAKIIPDLKATLQAFSDSMNRFQSAVSALSAVAAGYASSAKSSVAALGDYVSVVNSAESFVDATSDVDVSILLVDNYNAQLSEIANATAGLIANIPLRDLIIPDGRHVRPVPVRPVPMPVRPVPGE
jgi:hypothetical protein